jgi:predicted acyltransferase
MSAAAQVPAVDRGRLWSIDALRGFDMFWIIGGETVIERLAVVGRWPWKQDIKEQLRHVEWEGFHFEDLIFPLFLFLVGAVLPFSLGKLTGPGVSRRAAYWRILRRTLLLYVLGLIYYGPGGLLNFAPNDQRYFGVLQRIAICYGIAAVITLHTRVSGQVVALLAILIGYWAILTKIPVPDGAAGDLSPAGNLSGYIDRWIRDHLGGKLWTKYYDNEGLLSTLPAVGTTLLGVLAGHWLRSGYGAPVKTIGLLVAGGACLAAGMAWAGDIHGVPAHFVFPAIKNLWTSSYVLIAGGWSLLLMALFYGVIDGLGWRSIGFFFEVIGANAIVAYVAHRFVNFDQMANHLFGGLARRVERYYPTPDLIGAVGVTDVIQAVGVLTLVWLFLYVLYRHRIFLRV